jgi:hypothetical protein
VNGGEAGPTGLDKCQRRCLYVDGALLKKSEPITIMIQSEQGKGILMIRDDEKENCIVEHLQIQKAVGTTSHSQPYFGVIETDTVNFHSLPNVGH